MEGMELKGFDSSLLDEFRRREREKYDESYFELEYWREDRLGYNQACDYRYDDPDHEERFTLIAKTIWECADARSIVDIGCGPGCLLKELESDVDCVGVDTSSRAIKLAGEKCGSDVYVAQGGIEALPFAPNSFDVAICLEVLEHIPAFDIFDAVLELKRVSRSLVVMSINTQKVYEYHPTVLSGETWRTVLSAAGMTMEEKIECCFTENVGEARPEYEWFAYSPG